MPSGSGPVTGGVTSNRMTVDPLDWSEQARLQRGGLGVTPRVWKPTDIRYMTEL